MVLGLAASDNCKCITWSQGDEHDQLQLPLLRMYSVLQDKGKVAEQAPPCQGAPGKGPATWSKRSKYSNKTVTPKQQLKRHSVHNYTGVNC